MDLFKELGEALNPNNNKLNENEMKNEKKTCYQCKHKGDVPGSTHSRCEFNWNKATHEKPKGNDHGIKMGWFMWPWNYDPIWMIGQCGEFEQK